MSAFREAVRELPDAVFADVLESEEAYLFVLDLPGVTAETVDLTVEHGLLHVEATREMDVPAAFDSVNTERDTELSFEFPIPMDATGEEAQATLEDGVLELTLSKQSTATKTTIPVTE